MTRIGLTSWEHIYRAREEGRIPRVWKRGHLREHLQEPTGPFSRNTINTIPSNYYITKTEVAIWDIRFEWDTIPKCGWWDAGSTS